MRKNRFIEQDRGYQLISRVAHRAFFLDARGLCLDCEGLVAKTDPGITMSPVQEYKLA